MSSRRSTPEGIEDAPEVPGEGSPIGETVKLGVGMLTAQCPEPDGASHQNAYRELLDFAAEAELCGLDSVWLSEHHFVNDGYMPSVLPVAAAIAARTERITIGTGLMLAPFQNDIRLAEDAATVDLLSGGRLLLGLGTGWRPEEFGGFGVANERLGARLESTVANLRHAWAGEAVALGSGAPVRVTPQPTRGSSLPIWVGALRPAGIQRAARIADGLLAARMDADGLRIYVDMLNEAMVSAGRSRDSSLEVGLHLPVIVETRKHSWADVRDYFHYVEWKYLDMRAPYASRAGGSRPPRLTSQSEAELRAKAVIGSPGQVVDQIGRLDEAARGNFTFIARLYWPGMPYPRLQSGLHDYADLVARQLVDRSLEVTA